MRLQGVTDAAGHGDVFVEVVDGDGQTTTRADGYFRIVVAAGSPTLRLSRVGYGSQEVSVGIVEPRTTLTVPEAIVLSARPGGVVGRIRLMQFETRSRLQDVVVQLFGDGGEPIAVAEPDPSGRFVFDNVPLGEWRIEGSHPGYDTRDAVVMVGAGSLVDAGELTLNHQSTTAGRVSFDGRLPWPIAACTVARRSR